MTKAERIRLIRTYFEEIDRIEGEIPCILWRHTKQRDVYLYSREDESLANHEIILVKSPSTKVDKALKYAVKHYFQTAEELEVILNSLVVSYRKPREYSKKMTSFISENVDQNYRNGWEKGSSPASNVASTSSKTQRFNPQFIEAAVPQTSKQLDSNTTNFSQYYGQKPEKKLLWPVLGILSTVVFLVVLFITNPSETKHQLAVQGKVMAGIQNTMVSDDRADMSLVEASSAKNAVVSSAIPSVVRRKNFWLFSMTELKNYQDSETVGVGLFGNVFLWEDAHSFISFFSDESGEGIKKMTKPGKGEEDFYAMKNAVIVAIMEKYFTDPHNKGELSYKFVFHNRSDKELKSLRGEVVFSNNTGEVVEVLPLIYQRELGANERAIYHVTQKITDAEDKSKELVETELPDLVVEWEPQELTFSDGTSLSM